MKSLKAKDIEKLENTSLASTLVGGGAEGAIEADCVVSCINACGVGTCIAGSCCVECTNASCFCTGCTAASGDLCVCTADNSACGDSDAVLRLDR